MRLAPFHQRLTDEEVVDQRFRSISRPNAPPGRFYRGGTGGAENFDVASKPKRQIMWSDVLNRRVELRSDGTIGAILSSSDDEEGSGVEGTTTAATAGSRPRRRPRRLHRRIATGRSITWTSAFATVTTTTREATMTPAAEVNLGIAHLLARRSLHFPNDG